MEMEDEVVVGRYQYRHDAEMAQGYLKDAGIPSVLVADDAAGIEAGLMFSNPAELRVAPSDGEKARGLLEEAGMTGDQVEGEA